MSRQLSSYGTLGAVLLPPGHDLQSIDDPGFMILPASDRGFSSTSCWRVESREPAVASRPFFIDREQKAVRVDTTPA